MDSDYTQRIAATSFAVSWTGDGCGRRRSVQYWWEEQSERMDWYSREAGFNPIKFGSSETNPEPEDLLKCRA